VVSIPWRFFLIRQPSLRCPSSFKPPFLQQFGRLGLYHGLSRHSSESFVRQEPSSSCIAESVHCLRRLRPSSSLSSTATSALGANWPAEAPIGPTRVARSVRTRQAPAGPEANNSRRGADQGRAAPNPPVGKGAWAQAREAVSESPPVQHRAISLLLAPAAAGASLPSHLLAEHHQLLQV